MSAADRWERIEQLFGALFELPPEERERALDAVDDADLRAEVGTLLSTHQELTFGDGKFLAELDSSRAARLLERAHPEEKPSSVGRYRIVRQLARGGMGIVYLAHDPRLDRPVALKLLPPYLNADPAAVRGLGDEARAASALDHTHIETVYEIGDTEDGRVFIAMAYYDGDTLRERIKRGPLSVPDAIDLGSQLAEGLSAAHRNGIIHRDIKPENILVTRDGVLKIVDFGVAKIMKEGLSSAGLPLGTAAYMSPEQTRGEPLDHRTDLWSTGVVLYEMLAGVRPFQGEGEALIHAIRNDPPRTLSVDRPDLTVPLVNCVEMCLEKMRERRHESADALALVLQEVADIVPRRREDTADRPRRRHAGIAAAVAIPAMLLAGFLTWGDRAVPPSGAADAVAPGIAVLPFEVRGEDLGVWREGMVDLLSIGLDGATGLRAIDSRTVLARWRQAEQQGGTPDLARALDVARATGARYAVIGNVASSGTGMRLAAQIYSLEDGNSLASIQAEGSPDSLFALVDRLSIDVLAAVWQGKEQPGRVIDLTRITTSSLPALKAFLEGESLLRRSDFGGAVTAYERAASADSTFAFALYHLGLAAGWIGDAPLQNEAYERALRHVGRLPEREALLFRATLGYHNAVPDVPTAIRLLKEATRRYPDDVDAWYFLGDSYYHAGDQALATQNESEKAFRKAVELDPGFAPAQIHLVHTAFIHRPDSARAALLIDGFHDLAPDTSFDQENRIAFGLAYGDSSRRGQALAALDTLPPGSLVVLATEYLDHPRFGTMRDAVLGHGGREQSIPERMMAYWRFDNSLTLGRWRLAVEHLQDPLMYPGLRMAGLYMLHSAALPIPQLDLDGALSPAAVDSVAVDSRSASMWFYPGAYAGDNAQWTDHAAGVTRLRVEGNRFLAQGDTANARVMMGAAMALDGQRLWRQGEADRALPLLIRGQVQSSWSTSASREAVNATIRWWIGELLLEMGRPEDAVLYFASFWNDPLAAWRLGPIYEQIGEPAKAVEAYSLVATSWMDGESEFRARALESLAAVRRLRG